MLLFFLYENAQSMHLDSILIWYMLMRMQLEKNNTRATFKLFQVDITSLSHTHTV